MNVPVVEKLTLEQFFFSVDKIELEGLTFFQIHADVILSPGAAKRYTFQFDADGFEKFKAKLATAGTKLELARTMPPPINNVPA